MPNSHLPRASAPRASAPHAGAAPLTTFASLGLNANSLKALDALGFEAPTPIQAKAIPIAIAGGDVIGTAQTGTGKTAAFVLPMLERIKPNDQHVALVLAPTRELALQIHTELQRLSGSGRPLSVVLIGGVPIGPQRGLLKQRLPVIIATPGRLVDHLQQRTVTMQNIHTLVLDEADRMLDMGFAPQLERVLQALPKKRQSMLFSATMSPDVTKFANRHMTAPTLVGVAPSGTTAAKVEQKAWLVRDDLKLPLLATLLKSEMGRVLVFVRTRGRADKFAKKLERLGEGVGRLHSDRSQAQRKAALDSFRSGHARVLVATDLAARGIDVKDIALVLNIDLPRNPEDYVHRIGRTGRAEGSGTAISFISNEERKLWGPIERVIRQRVMPERIDEQDEVLKELVAKLAVAEPAGARRDDDANRNRGRFNRGGGSGGSGGRGGSSSGRGGSSGGSSSRGGGEGGGGGGGAGGQRPGKRPFKRFGSRPA